MKTQNESQSIYSHSSSLTDFSLYASLNNNDNNGNNGNNEYQENKELCSSIASIKTGSSFFSIKTDNNSIKTDNKSIKTDNKSIKTDNKLNTIKENTISHNSICINDNNNNVSKNSTAPKLFNTILDKCSLNKIYIDVAVICEEYNDIGVMCNDHITNLDEIDITMDIFQHIFYPYKENFGLNKDFLINNCNLLPFISFLPEFRSVSGKKFYLLEELIGNIESDLGISRNCFTKESLVELTNEITSIRSLLDIKCCSVLSSLTWSNILEIIKNYKLIKKEVVPILIVNIVFKTPTQGVNDTIIRFQYKISNIN